MKTKITLEVELEYEGKMSKDQINAVKLRCHTRLIGSMGWGSLSYPDHDIIKFPEVKVKEHGYKQ